MSRKKDRPLYATIMRPNGTESTGEIPSRYKLLWKQVNDRDSEFFLTNPTITEYTRQYIPGEFWPLHPKAETVIVKRFGDKRARIPVGINGEMVGD